MSSLKDLQDAATTAFDLPRGDAAWIKEADAALFADLTRDLPAAPAHWLATIVPPADLCRRLLHDRMRALGTPADEVIDWPFDADTGAPESEAPTLAPKLVEALLRAARGERVHPLCAILPDGSRCDCPEHTERDHPAQTPFTPRARLPDWRQRATAEPAALFAWWTRWPNANVGVAGGSKRGSTARGQREAAIQFLINLLSEDTPLSDAWCRRATQVLRIARNAGISEATLRRAADELGIVHRPGVGDGFQWWEWHWPPKARQRWLERGQDNADLAAPYLADPTD